jgi:hypothetical protein
MEAMLSVNDIWMADILLVSLYTFYAFLLILLLYSLYSAVQTFRERVSWGKARIMGVPFSLFIWLQIVFYLVLLDATYSVVGLLLWTPLWADLAVSLGIILLAWWIFWRLSKRSTFKRQLFIPLVMVPLGVPGVHVIGQVAQTGVIEVSQKVGIGVLKYGDSLEGLAIKNVDTIVEAIPIVRHFPLTMKTVAGEVTFTNSFEKGILGDAITARRMTALGYSKLPSKYNLINGIDGIFVKRDATGAIVELLIVENKVDSSRLALKQMSDEWLFSRIEKMKTAGNEKVRTTGEILDTLLLQQPQVVRKELWQHDLKNGSTVVRSVSADGKPGEILRRWSDALIQNQLIDRCRRQIYVCNF